MFIWYPDIPDERVLCFHGPLTRYVKLRIVHVPGMPGTLSPPAPVSDPDMHHGTWVTHVPLYMPGSLSSGFLWRRWWEKRSRHSRRMRNPWLKYLTKALCIRTIIVVRYRSSVPFHNIMLLLTTTMCQRTNLVIYTLSITVAHSEIL